MTRRKKTRKIGQIGVRKQESRPSDSSDSRKKKAPKGQKSGNRNSLLMETNNSSSQAIKVKKNPKHGSKKKIELVKSSVPKAEKPKAPSHKPQVQLKKVAVVDITPEQELLQLEGDDKLIELAQRVDAGELLTGKDAKYFNQKMARHEELLDILGIEQEDEPKDEFANLGGDEWDDFLTEDD